MANTRNYRTPALNGTDDADVPTWLDRLAQDVAGDMDKNLKPKVLGAVDLNTITTAGPYFQDYPGQLGSTQNYPINRVGTLTVTTDDSSGGNIITQIFRTNEGQSYTRTRVSGTWSQWQTVTITPLGGDLDLVMKPGLYLCDWAGAATPENHYPTQATGVLQVFNAGTVWDSAIQEYRVLGTYAHAGKIFRREKHSNGAWGAWEVTQPSTVAPTANREVLRDASGRAKAAAPAADDDLTTKAYVDAAISGRPASSGTASRTFARYPGYMQLADDVASLPAITSKTTVDLMALTAADRDKFFSVPSMIENWLGGPAPTNSLGSGQTWFFGLVTDSQKIILKGSHGLQDGFVDVLVDGELTDQYSVVKFPTYTGHESGLYLEFPHKRVRTVEISSRMKIWKYEVESGSQHTGYKRNTAKVGILGDSWIDGTTQAESTIGQRLLTRTPWQVGISALGGSGFVSGGPSGLNYTGPTRLGKMAAWAPDVCLVWGSINDNSQPPADVEAAARTIVTTLLAAKAGMKIIFTGPQITSGTHAAIFAALQNVANDYPTSVKLYNAAAKLVDGQTGPWDGAHPSPRGAIQVAEWLTELIKIDAPAL